MYIQTLPGFEGHPLSWLYPVKREGKARDKGKVPGGRGCWSWYGECGSEGEEGEEEEEEGDGLSGANGVARQEGGEIKTGQAARAERRAGKGMSVSDLAATTKSPTLRSDELSSWSGALSSSTATATSELIPKPSLRKASPLRPLDCLTRGARAKLMEVQERYEGDKAAILTVLVSTLHHLLATSKQGVCSRWQAYRCPIAGLARSGTQRSSQCGYGD